MDNKYTFSVLEYSGTCESLHLLSSSVLTEVASTSFEGVRAQDTPGAFLFLAVIGGFRSKLTRVDTTSFDRPFFEQHTHLPYSSTRVDAL